MLLALLRSAPIYPSLLDVATDTADDLPLAINEAWNKLADRDRHSAELIKLRFFGGLPNPEAAPYRIVGRARCPERAVRAKGDDGCEGVWAWMARECGGRMASGPWRPGD